MGVFYNIRVEIIILKLISFFSFFFFLVFLVLHPWHMEVPKLEGKLELQLNLFSLQGPLQFCFSQNNTGSYSKAQKNLSIAWGKGFFS